MLPEPWQSLWFSFIIIMKIYMHYLICNYNCGLAYEHMSSLVIRWIEDFVYGKVLKFSG